MKCPDIDDLITLATDPNVPAAAHVDVCRACRERLDLIEALGPAGPLEPVPDTLVERVMASLPAPLGATGRRRPADFAPGHAALTFLLASVTTALAGALGQAQDGGITILGFVSVLVGIAAAMAEPRVLRLREESW